MRRRFLVACILCGLAMQFVQPGRAQTAPANLVGSWQLTLVPNVPPGTSPPSIQIPGLATFTSDGTAIATAGGVLVGSLSISGTPTAGPSPAFGNWNAGGAVGHAVIKLISLVTNPNGSLFATRTFIATVAPGSGGTDFSGTYTVETVENDGTIVIVSSGTISGTLIPHILPPA